MPTSCWMHLSYVAQILRELRPNSVLDIGTGFGMYGFLARDYLDVYEGRPYKETWQVRIEGIEAWPDYVSPVHHHIYDAVHIGNALEVLNRLGSYDIIIAGDVVEHFRKEEGLDLLHKMIAHSRKWILVSIPMGNNWPQDPSGGNPFQTHLSVWTQNELRGMGFSLKEFRDETLRPYSVGLLAQNGAQSVDMATIYARELYLAAHRCVPLIDVLRSGLRRLHRQG